MRMIELYKTKIIKLFAILILPLVFIAAGCSNSLPNNNVSDNPVDTAIIGISGNPGALFGNGCSESVIQVNTNIVEDGTPIEFEITFSIDLPPELRGCLFDASPVVFNEMAFVNYLAGVLIGVEQIATVNISATIDKGNGDTEADFISLTLQGVGIIPPGSIDIEVPFETDAPLTVFVTLPFQTVGIKPGTIVDLFVSDESLGVIEPNPAIVQGSEESGTFIVEYVANLGVGGTQVITAIIDLEIPPELQAICPVPAAEDLRIEATVIINQSVAEPEEEDDMMMEEM